MTEADEERARAEAALAVGDLRHAFLHAAHGLQTSPDDGQFIGLIEAIYKKTGSEEALFQPGQLDFAVAIALAIGRAAAGRLDGAAAMMAQALHVAPGAHGAHLLARWISAGARPDAAVAAALASPGDPMIGRLRLRPGERALCQRFAAVARATLGAPSPDPNALLASSGLLRRAGDAQGALACVARLEKSLPRLPSSVLVMKGLALRLDGRCDEAVEAFDQAERAGVHRLTACCERARAYLDAERWGEALSALDPGDDAEARAMLRWLGEERDGRRDGPGHQIYGPRPDADAFRLEAYPFTTDFCAPSDLAIQLLHQNKNALAGIEVGVSFMDCPSTRAAVALACEGAPDPARASYKFGSVTGVDPRPHDGERALSVWVYEGTTPRAAYPAPGPEVSAAIAHLRGAPRNVRSWWTLAVELGPWLGPRRIHELLGACSSPPALAPGEFAPDALLRQQMAATLLLANVDGGWEGSARRHALLSLLRGSIDWTTLCAAVALAEITFDELSASEEVQGAFQRLAPRVPRLWSWLTSTLQVCFKRLPGAPRDAIKAFP